MSVVCLLLMWHPEVWPPLRVKRNIHGFPKPESFKLQTLPLHLQISKLTYQNFGFCHAQVPLELLSPDTQT